MWAPPGRDGGRHPAHAHQHAKGLKPFVMTNLKTLRPQRETARQWAGRGVGQHPEPERLLDHRPGRHHHQVPRGGLRRLDLRRLQRLHHQRGQVFGADGGRRIPVGAVERRHRKRAAHQVGRGGLGHLQQQDRRRALVHAGRQHPRGHVRDVRQRRPAGAHGLQEPDRHLQLQRHGRRRQPTARPMWPRPWTTSTPTPTPA
jgi:hypothetical protein